MIIFCDLMAQLGLLSDFIIVVLQQDGATATMKEPIGLIEQTNPTSSEMRELVMQTSEPVYNR